MDDRRDPKAEGGPASNRIEVMESRTAVTSAVAELRKELMRLTERAQVVESSLGQERQQREAALAEAEALRARELEADERAKAAEERARAAEERTKIAEVRAKTSEGRSRTAEDRAKMTEDRANVAIERNRRAEDRAKVAEEAARIAEEGAKAAEERAKATEERARDAEERATIAEAAAKATEARAKAAEERAKIAEELAKTAQERATALEARAKASEERSRTTEELAKTAGERAKAAEDHSKAAEERARATEERAKATEQRAKAAEERAKAAEERAKTAEERARATDVLARAAEAFAKDAEARAAAAEASAAAAEAGVAAAEASAAAERARADAAEAAEVEIGRNLLDLHDHVKTAFSRIPSFAPPPQSGEPSGQLGVGDIPRAAAMPRMAPSKPPSQAPAPLPPPSVASAPVEPDPFPSIRPPPPAIYSSPPPAPSAPPPRLHPRSNPPDATPAAPGVMQSVSRAVTPPPPVVLDAPVAMGSVNPPPMMQLPTKDSTKLRSTPELSSLDDEWSKPMLLDMPLPVRQERDALLLSLREPAKAAAAVAALKERDWLRGLPPDSLVEDLAGIQYDSESPTFEIARAWERAVMSQVVVIHLQEERDPFLRQHDAWLVQHLGAAPDWQPIVQIALRHEESVGTRKWLLMALARFAGAQGVGWKEMNGPMTTLAFDPDPLVRDAAATVIEALPKSDEKRRLLLEILRKDEDENVLSRAIQAIGGTLPIEIGTALAERLLGHPSARVQEAVRDLIALARARRAQSLPPPARGS